MATLDALRAAPPTVSTTRGGVLALPLPPPGFVRLRAVKNTALGLVAEFGRLDEDDDDIRPTGYSEMTFDEREGRVSISRPSGQAPITMEIPLLLDRWTQQASIEPELRVLERLAGADQKTPPPVLIIEGIGVPNSYSRDPSLRWMNNGDLQWGTIRRANGERCLAEVTITLTQLVGPTVVGDDASTSDGQRVMFTVPAGDRLRTLQAIADAHGTTWQVLRKLNPSLPSDPDKKLPQGRQVRVA